MPLARTEVGMGRRPKAAEKVASLSPDSPDLLNAIMDEAKPLSRVCTTEARAGTSKFAPSGPAHSKVIFGSDDSTDAPRKRAPDMPVTLTMRASASASTASRARQPVALEKRAAPQSADSLRTGRGMLMTASALVEEAEGHGLVTAGRSAAEATASRSHVPDALEPSMHTEVRVETMGLEVKVDPEHTGAHAAHGPAFTNEPRHAASEMKGLIVPIVLQSAPKAPATQAHAATEALPPCACVQKPWPLHGSNAHAASHVVAFATDV